MGSPLSDDFRQMFEVSVMRFRMLSDSLNILSIPISDNYDPEPVEGKYVEE
jgi:hypothetical protein